MIQQESAIYLRILRKWLWLIVLLVSATVVTMVFVSLRAEPMYEARVTIQVSAPPPQEVPLYSDYNRQALSQEIEQTRVNLASYLELGDVAEQVVEQFPELGLTARDLRERITVEAPANSQLIILHVRAHDAETAALLANTLAEVGLKSYAEFLAQPTVLAREFIEEQISLARAQLLEAETELEKFRLENKVYDPEQTIRDHNNLLNTLRQSRDLALAQDRADEAEDLQTLINNREIDLDALIRLIPEYHSLADRVGHTRESTDFLTERRNEAQIKENQILSMSSIQIMNPARPPRAALPVLSPAVIAFSLVSSLIAGILLAFFLETLEASGVTRRAKAQQVHTPS